MNTSDEYVEGKIGEIMDTLLKAKNAKAVINLSISDSPIKNISTGEMIPTINIQVLINESILNKFIKNTKQRDFFT